jgi:hypothetical protein
MMIGDAENPVMRVQWRRVSEKGGAFDAGKWLERRFKKQKITPSPNPPAPARFAETAWAQDVEVRQDEQKTLWYGYSRAAGLLVEIVVTSLTDKRLRKEIFKTVVPGMKVSAPDEPCRWALHDVGFTSPPGFEIGRRRLNAGDIALELRKGKRERLLVRQLYPAGLAVSRRTLDRWLEVPPFLERRRAWKPGREDWRSRAGVEGIRRCGWRRLPAPVGRFAPRYTTAIAAVDEGLDRLLIAEHQARRQDGADVAEWTVGRMNEGLALPAEAGPGAARGSAAARPAAAAGKKRRKPRLTRGQALFATPVKGPALKTERKDGKLYVTVEFERPRWQRFLGADRLCKRTFGLDECGEQVYSRCDGRTPAADIVESFAHDRHISVSEAEVAVTAFLKTLMGKGLIVMSVAK